jgi:hypothetical protein
MDRSLHRTDGPRRFHSALSIEGIFLGYMLGGVDFFQNNEILLFLHDLRAVSLDKTDGCAVLSILLISMQLPRSTMGMFQWRTV